MVGVDRGRDGVDEGLRRVARPRRGVRAGGDGTGRVLALADEAAPAPGVERGPRRGRERHSDRDRRPARRALQLVPEHRGDADRRAVGEREDARQHEPEHGPVHQRRQAPEPLVARGRSVSSTSRTSTISAEIQTRSSRPSEAEERARAADQDREPADPGQQRLAVADQPDRDRPDAHRPEDDDGAERLGPATPSGFSTSPKERSGPGASSPATASAPRPRARRTPAAARPARPAARSAASAAPARRPARSRPRRRRRRAIAAASAPGSEPGLDDEPMDRVLTGEARRPRCAGHGEHHPRDRRRRRPHRQRRSDVGEQRVRDEEHEVRPDLPGRRRPVRQRRERRVVGDVHASTAIGSSPPSTHNTPIRLAALHRHRGASRA